MNTNKFLIGGIIGGIAYFFLGWVVWGMLLMNFMTEHTTDLGKAVMRKDASGEVTMIWWALIVANLLWGFLLSYVLVKSNTSSVSGGASTGAVLGLLTSAGINCFNYAFMDMTDGYTAMAVDIAASTVVSAVVGAIVGWYLSMGKKG
jgi:hypothetical protein